MVHFRTFLLFCLMGIMSPAFAQDVFSYIVYLTDKEGSPYSVENPDAFMSAEALERRSAQLIPIRENDLPLSPVYLNQLEQNGFELLGQSRWLNAVLVQTEHIDAETELTDYPFVQKTQWAATYTPGGRQEYPEPVRDELKQRKEGHSVNSLAYGYAAPQTMLHNGQFLHQNGYRGDGMVIAVLDAGFINVDENPAFEALRTDGRLLTTMDFVQYDTGVFESSGHGSQVLSTMAGVLGYDYLGTAPNASYILLKTEDVRSEQLVEEFNYVLGLEYADQMGADVVNTSLGYTRFNHATMDHEPDELNGDGLIASRGADLGASKGMFIINSAGNEGDSDWQFTSIPADGDSVLAVGSVNTNGIRSAFSGQGWPGVETIKPNVMGVGEGTVLVNTNGDIYQANGTSYSAPVIAGLVACLWQAFPDRTNMEIMDAIQQSSSQYLNPDLLSGYGIPDFQAAFALLFQQEVFVNELDGIRIFPNPFTRDITLTLEEVPDQDMDISLINEVGQVLTATTVLSGSRKTVNLRFDDVENLSFGLYFLRIRTEAEVYMFKLIKV